jgi:hypothetical protein
LTLELFAFCEIAGPIVARKGGAYPNFCRSEGTLLYLGSRRGISRVKLSLSSAIKACSFPFPLRSRDPGNGLLRGASHATD